MTKTWRFWRYLSPECNTDIFIETVAQVVQTAATSPREAKAVFKDFKDYTVLLLHFRAFTAVALSTV